MTHTNKQVQRLLLSCFEVFTNVDGKNIHPCVNNSWFDNCNQLVWGNCIFHLASKGENKCIFVFCQNKIDIQNICIMKNEFEMEISFTLPAFLTTFS